MRAIVGRPALLTLEVDDIEGIPTDADEDTEVTLDIYAGDGVTPIELGAIANDDETTGLYTYALAPQTQLDDLQVTWNAIVDGQSQVTADVVRIVGSRLLSPADCRRDPVLQKLMNTPDDRRVLAQVLDNTEDLFADRLGYPAALEGVRFNFDAKRGMVSEAYAYGNVQGSLLEGDPGLGFGFGGDRLIIPGVAKPQTAYAISVNGNAFSDDLLSQIQPGNGYLVWTGGRSWPSGNYVMWMTHGLSSVPGDLKGAAQKYAAYAAKRTPSLGGQGSLIPERTASMTTEGGTIVFAVPTADRPTGLPEVDAVLFAYSRQSII